jgi:hypothetical protein
MQFNTRTLLWFIVAIISVAQFSIRPSTLACCAGNLALYNLAYDLYSVSSIQKTASSVQLRTNEVAPVSKGHQAGFSLLRESRPACCSVRNGCFHLESKAIGA